MATNEEVEFVIKVDGVDQIKKDLNTLSKSIDEIGKKAKQSSDSISSDWKKVGKSSAQVDKITDSVEDLQDETVELGKTTETTTSGMAKAWGFLTSRLAVVGATIGLAGKQSMEFARVSAGLSDEMKQYAKELSKANIETDSQIAGFLKSAQTAGLSSDMMKKLARDAIDLGKAYPHESSETLHDNLVMLNTTGEAQGFVVDILEQKYKTLDVQSISTADKIKAINEIVAETSKTMENLSVTKIQTITGSLKNMFSTLGDLFIGLADKLGVLDGLSDSLSYISSAFAKGTSLLLMRVEYYVLAIKKLFATITGIDYSLLGDNVAQSLKIVGLTLIANIEKISNNVGLGLSKFGYNLKSKIADIINSLPKSLVPKSLSDWADNVDTEWSKTKKTYENNIKDIEDRIKDFNDLKPETIIPEVDTSDYDKKMEVILKAYNKLRDSAKETRKSLDIDGEANVNTSIGKVNFDQLINEATAARETIIKAFRDGLIKPEDLEDSLKSVEDWSNKVKALMEQGLTFDEAIKIQKIIQMPEEEGILDGAKAQVQSFADYWNDTSSRLGDVTKQAMDGMTNAIFDMVTKGKANFKDLAASILAAIVKMQIAQAVAGIFTGGSSFVGNLLGGATKHTGDVPSYHTGTVPSYHTGTLRTDERMAKLQVGEAVINRTATQNNREALSAMNRGAKIDMESGNTQNVNVNFSVNAIDSSSFRQYLAQNKNDITGIVNDAISKNGSTRRVIKANL